MDREAAFLPGEELLIIQKEFAGFSDSFGVRPVPFIIGK
jgi:hypothetical protein